MASRVSRCSLLPLYADAGLTNKDKINLSFERNTNVCRPLFPTYPYRSMGTGGDGVESGDGGVCRVGAMADPGCARA